MSPRVFACTFARGGSKGVPGKNMAPLGGIPLIGRAVQCAKEATLVDRVFVSTDDEAIAACAREYGAEVPFMRPAELATDTSAELHSWQHFIRSMRDAGEDFDVLVSVPTTSPLRIPADVDQAVEALLAHDDADIIITVTEAHRNPHFNQVKLDPSGHASVVLGAKYANRQEAPLVQDITTVAYAARVDYVLATEGSLAGRMRTVEVPKARSVDIDTPLDMALAEFLLSRPELLK